MPDRDRNKLRNAMEKNEIDILDILIILAKHKKFIIITTLIVSIAAVIYSLVVPEKWTSTATFKPTISNNSEIGMFSSIMSGDISSLLGGSQEQSELIDVIKSRTFLEPVIDKFDLIDYFEIEHEDPYYVRETTLKTFREEILSVELDQETGIFSISIITKNRELSADIANYLVRELEDYLQNVRMTKGKEERQFLEKRISEINDQLVKYTEELKEFQQKYNVLELESQLPPMLNSYTELVSQYMEEDIKLQLSKSYLKTDSNQSKMYELKTDELIKQIKKIETGKNSIINYQIPLDSIPNLSQKYTLLMTKLEILKKVYETVYPQYEIAKLQELRDTQTINIIDSAIPSGLRTWPKRGFMCILSFTLAFVFSCFLIIINKVLSTKKDKIKLLYESLFG